MNGATLSKAMLGRLSLSRYNQLAPGITQALQRANCTTVNRAAMFCAQVGTESGGLQWMEEIASGGEYEGRKDLGNIYPGDGKRFKGRGPIQVTGRHNYTNLSKWAHAKGYVPTATFFVDHPEKLSELAYVWLGPVWYWTVARNMNAYADRADIRGATIAVNGGTNGLADRTHRWNVCLAIGSALLSGSAPSAIRHADTGQDLNAESSTADVKALQKILGVTADGVAGPATVGALIVKAGYAKEASPTLDVKGSNTVKKVQARINQQMHTALTVDGLWGPATAIAFHDYLAAGGKLTDLAGQKIVQPPKPAAAQLTVDGYLGADTLNRWAAVMGTHTGKADLVKAVQRFLNAKGARDEHGHKLAVDGKGLYNNTAKTTAASHTQYALQRYLKMPVIDGKLSSPSACVKEVQKRLNKAKTGSKEF